MTGNCGLEEMCADIADRHDVDYDTVMEYSRDRIREYARDGELTESLVDFAFPPHALPEPEPELDARALWALPPQHGVSHL